MYHHLICNLPRTAAPERGSNGYTNPPVKRFRPTEWHRGSLRLISVILYIYNVNLRLFLFPEAFRGASDCIRDADRARGTERHPRLAPVSSGR